jgi:hypothetical protein
MQHMNNMYTGIYVGYVSYVPTKTYVSYVYAPVCSIHTIPTLHTICSIGQYVPTGTYVVYVSYALNVTFETYVPHEYQ